MYKLPAYLVNDNDIVSTCEKGVGHPAADEPRASRD